MKKVILAVFSFAAFSTGVFAEGISFRNELTTNVINYFNPKKDGLDSNTSFFDTKERVIANCEYGIVKAGVDAKGYFQKSNKFDSDSNYTADWNNDETDWYVEFSPFNQLSLGFSDELYTAGSYLPVYDDNVSVGNYSTNGFAFIIRAIDNLTIGAGNDVKATFFTDNGHDDDWDLNLAAGLDLSVEDVSIGGSIRGIGTDGHFKAGIYGSIKAIKSLVVNLGFTYSKDGGLGLDNVTYISSRQYAMDSNDNVKGYNLNKLLGIYGKNVFTAGLMFDADVVKVASDLALNIKANDEHGIYDLYLAGDVLVGIDSNIGIDIKAFILSDFGDTDADMTLGVKPRFIYTMGKHELSAGLFIQTMFDSNWGYTAIGVPLGWKYTY